MYMSSCEWSPGLWSIPTHTDVDLALPESCQITRREESCTNQTVINSALCNLPEGRGLSGPSFQYRGGRAHCEQEEICWTGQSHCKTLENRGSNHNDMAKRDHELLVVDVEWIPSCLKLGILSLFTRVEARIPQCKQLSPSIQSFPKF